MQRHPTLHTSWQHALGAYMETPHFRALWQKVKRDYSDASTVVYPEQRHVFRAFIETPLDTVTVVILGQDPYHGTGQADGLCFSVPSGVQAPPSLRNILKELRDDVGYCSTHTDLTHWAQQGVLLLNTVLTVLKNKPASHAQRGWEDFTDHVIKTISESQEYVVFMLWGAYAQGKAPLIDTQKHLVLTAPHPSPLSAHRGFFGCKHFSQANTYLKKRGKRPIEW